MESFRERSSKWKLDFSSREVGLAGMNIVMVCCILRVGLYISNACCEDARANIANIILESTPLLNKALHRSSATMQVVVLQETWFPV